MQTCKNTRTGKNPFKSSSSEDHLLGLSEFSNEHRVAGATTGTACLRKGKHHGEVCAPAGGQTNGRTAGQGWAQDCKLQWQACDFGLCDMCFPE